MFVEKNLARIDDEETCEDYVYGDSKDGAHVLFEITEHILDYVGQ